MENNKELNEWRCFGCGRALGIYDGKQFSVRTGNMQVIDFVSEKITGRCKCGLIIEIIGKVVSFKRNVLPVDN